VEVFTTGTSSNSAKENATLEGVRTRRFPFFNIPLARGSGIVSPALTFALARRMRQVDLVHVHAGRDFVSLPAMVLCWVTGTPYVTQTHGMVLKGDHPAKRVVDKFLLRPLMVRARRNYALQTTEYNDLLTVGIPATNIRILENGLATPTLPAWRANSPPVVLFASRLHPAKRVMAFAAMAQILLNGSTKATYHVMGADAGDLRKLERFLSNMTVSDRPVYMGERSHQETLEAFAGATVYVHPSDYDPFPMSLVEALAVGTPTVCTRACGIADLLIEADAGIVTGREPRDLARSVASVIEDPVLQRQLSDKGRQLVAGRLSIEKTVGQLERDYLALAAGSRSVREGIR